MRHSSIVIIVGFYISTTSIPSSRSSTECKGRPISRNFSADHSRILRIYHFSRTIPSGEGSRTEHGILFPVRTRSCVIKLPISETECVSFFFASSVQPQVLFTDSWQRTSIFLFPSFGNHVDLLMSTDRPFWSYRYSLYFLALMIILLL